MLHFEIVPHVVVMKMMMMKLLQLFRIVHTAKKKGLFK